MLRRARVAMNRYKVTKQLGDGTYGSVLKAVNRSTGEVVRIRRRARAARQLLHPATVTCLRHAVSPRLCSLPSARDAALALFARPFRAAAANRPRKPALQPRVPLTPHSLRTPPPSVRRSGS